MIGSFCAPGQRTLPGYRPFNLNIPQFAVRFQLFEFALCTARNGRDNGSPSAPHLPQCGVR
jgi:hypothetical protein